MILPVHERLRAHLTQVLSRLYAIEPQALPAVPIEYPPNRELGDLGTPVAFELAKRLRKAPRAIAQEIATAFGVLDGVTRVMTTAIALETSKGDLPLALGLGMVLLSLVIAVNLAAHGVRVLSQRHYG